MLSEDSNTQRDNFNEVFVFFVIVLFVALVRACLDEANCLYLDLCIYK